MANEVLVRVLERKRKYIWPEAQLNFWLIVMIAAAATIVGVFTYFMQLQSVFHLGVPWIFPYSIATGSLCLLFLLIILVLIQQRQLLPGIVVLGSFILFVLFLTGLIETSIQLYGPTGSVNSYCNLYKPSSGLANGQATLAWLETQGICQDWKAVFSFYIVGTVFLLWMMVMAWQVNQDNFD
ncbi:MAG: hypothetical protein Q9175_005931 [Cornicularia normoerica]